MNWWRWDFLNVAKLPEAPIQHVRNNNVVLAKMASKKHDLVIL